MNEVSGAKLKLVTSMFIYGTIGIFARYIPLPSAIISMIRGFIGAPFLLLILFLTKRKLSWPAIKNNFLLLCVLGMLLSFNWILLFEAYKYTTVATATLCYYFAPLIIVALSPILLKERMTLRKAVCIFVALVGMFFVSGVAANGIPSIAELKGVLLGLSAAMFYAFIVMLNKKLKDISAYDRTIVQLLFGAIILLPYNIFAGNFASFSLDTLTIVMLLILGVVHTGIAYYLYFGSMDCLSSQTLAIISYIDPVVAVVLSALILSEQLSVFDVIGAILILGSAFISELPEKKKAADPQSPA